MYTHRDPDLPKLPTSVRPRCKIKHVLCLMGDEVHSCPALVEGWSGTGVNQLQGNSVGLL